MPERMTYDGIRARLRKFYALCSTLAQFGVSYGGASRTGAAAVQHQSRTSRTEQDALRALALQKAADRLGMLQLSQALSELSEEQQEFCRLRFGEEMSFRAIEAFLPALKGGRKALSIYEREVCALLIGLLGFKPQAPKG